MEELKIIRKYSPFYTDTFFITVSTNPEFYPKRTKLKDWQKEWKRDSFNKRRFKNKKK